MIKVGINGFGRIGRAIFRNNLNKNFFEIVAINDINPDNDNIAYTLNYDTLYDRLPEIFRVEGDFIISPESNHKIAISHERSIADVNWASHNIDFVIDASGVLQNVLDAQKLISSGQVKKVFVTHAPKQVDFTMVLGANEHLLDVEKHHVISTSICDATAIAPVTKAIYEAFGFNYAYGTTLHPWLNYQNLMDGPASSWSVPGEIYHHFALGRSAIGNMIPKPTTAITATCNVLKTYGISEEIFGSFSYRTPTAIVGSADLTFHLNKDTSTKDVLALFEGLEQNQHWPIIHNNWEPLVSLDFKKADFGAVVDHRWTNVIQNRMLKLVLWYDNEWGYAARVLDQVLHVSKLLENK
jgi:glyceraldehyde 3-phosphate dehydrogenase